jgi:uncharacterized protein involved in exopolysaccharide biosynthesis
VNPEGVIEVIPEETRMVAAHVLAAPVAPGQDGRLLRLLLRERRRLVRWAVAGALAFAAIALLIPSRYESAAQLMPPDQGSSSVLGAALERAQALGLSADLLGAKTNGAVFVKILSSQSAEDALIERFDLRRAYGTRYAEQTRRRLEANSNIVEDRKSGVISIRVRDHDRARAQQMCAAYIAELIRLSTRLSTSAAGREREFLEQRLVIARREMDEAALQLSQYSSQSGLLNIPAQSKAMVESMAELQGKLVAAEAQLQGLRQVYGDQNLRVRSMESTVGDLRRNLRALAGSESGQTPVTDMPSIRRLPVVGVTYLDRLRQARMAEAIYETLTRQYELAKVQEAKDVPTVRVLDQPSWPERSVFPPRLALAVLGGLLGTVAAAVWLLWREVNPQDPRRTLVREAREAFGRDLRPVLRLLHPARAK